MVELLEATAAMTCMPSVIPVPSITVLCPSVMPVSTTATARSPFSSR